MSAVELKQTISQFSWAQGVFFSRLAMFANLTACDAITCAKMNVGRAVECLSKSGEAVLVWCQIKPTLGLAFLARQTTS